MCYGVDKDDVVVASLSLHTVVVSDGDGGGDAAVSNSKTTVKFIDAKGKTDG